MANRFESKENRIFRISDEAYRLISIAIFVGIALLFFLAVDATGKSSISKQQESLENALSRDIVQCYAIEGRYPPDLKYLEDHYGLTYDKETFFVDYIPVASNLYPDVTVIRIKK
ncbi:hypothetical protein [Butyrivibrio sp. XBB1001]|jgi:hypothetical protein|uniref:hypothetical protein n=1 Tax=Butyrivibrio sp. XBB1001 TaxID=1280682 RepID=UPI000407BB24|nr:hypothetical protein [Butyrivibrio sp. XBB1001]